MKKVLCLILIVAFSLSLLCSCSSSVNNNSSKETTTSEEYAVKQAVEGRLEMFYYGKTIGGNELVDSWGTIASVKRISSSKYTVSGQIQAKDKYGTIWKNNYDINVEKNYNGSWGADTFEFTSTSWSKY